MSIKKWEEEALRINTLSENESMNGFVSFILETESKDMTFHFPIKNKDYKYRFVVKTKTKNNF